MQISLFQAFLIGVVYYLGNIGTPWLSSDGIQEQTEAVKAMQQVPRLVT